MLKKRTMTNAPQVTIDVMVGKRCCKKAVHTKLLLSTLHQYNSTLAPRYITVLFYWSNNKEKDIIQPVGKNGKEVS